MNCSFWDATVNYYVLSGISRIVFNDQKRLIVQRGTSTGTEKYWIEKGINPFYREAGYNIKDVEFDGTYDYYIYANQSKIMLSTTTVFKAILLKGYNEEKYKQLLDDIVQLTFIKYPQVNNPR